MGEVLWCRTCETNRKASQHDNFVFCDVCGLVLRSYDFFPEPPSNQHRFHTFALKLGVSDHYAIQDAILCFHKTFLYFRHCRVVAAVCLYIGCRANRVPVMLMDLSVKLRVSVYYLGVRFLDVCEFLSVEVDGFRPPRIDDPLFMINRFMLMFSEENDRDFSVLLTALRILAAVRTDYVGGRRRLGGLCAAAVYMAGGFDSLNVDDVFPVEAVLSPLEFYWLDREFRSVAKEYKYRNGRGCMMGNVEDLCPHNDVDKFCHGFCRVCYNRFVELSEYFNITVPRQDDQVLCSEKRLSSLINFDALRQVFGDDDVAESTKTPSQESSGTINTMEQGQAREENCGDAQGREGSANKNDQREEVLANKVRRRFAQPKRRRLGLQT
ncbi:hypothetical protein DCAR_0832854 [Daucus carota subsp. sativus]|uniref:Uncharacterized protein n=1 Tax=Daucus carota subsp. sativus TaxID=79200 RepID=A0A175YRS9_DAUCS|nr:PREDICTED: uncharacterized protein LOC108198542 [Daucus carota subsp. sativus]WOH13344.1 hypothetical protein DCAR_0832854 [Daucus carota subsp. sativus]